MAKKQSNSGVRQPDYDLAVLNRETEQKGRVGAAWLNPDGSISIRLNPMVVLDSRPELVITLFKRQPHPTKKSAGSNYVPHDSDGEAPPF